MREFNTSTILHYKLSVVKKYSRNVAVLVQRCVSDKKTHLLTSLWLYCKKIIMYVLNESIQYLLNLAS
jgi:phage-related holin